MREIVFEAGVAPDVLALVEALQKKAALLLLPGEQRFAGEQGYRSAAALDPGRAPARRGDEFHLRHQHARGMLFAKQDGPAEKVHEGRAERAGEPVLACAHQVDVGLAVDLRAAEEEDVDAALPGEIEELARSFRERVALALVKEGEAQVPSTLLEKKRAGGRNRRGGTDGDVPRLISPLRDQAGDDAGKELFFGVQTNSSR